MGAEDRGILVGVDDSARSQGALEWAAAEARSRGVPLELVHVLDGRRFPTPFHPLMSVDEYGWQVLDRITGELRSRYPELVVRPALANGNSSAELVERSRDHLAVAVGRRGSGGFVRMLIGSTAFRVATDAGVPVVVVPEDWKPGTDRDGPVVVGVDYRDVQPAALRFAFEEAAQRGVRLVAVHGRDVPAIGWDGRPTPLDTNTDKSSEPTLASAIEAVRAEFPEVEVESLTSDSHPLTALLEEAPRAQLLVVGRHGKRGGGLPFGSVARAALHYAEIPLVIVPTVTDDL